MDKFEGTDVRKEGQVGSSHSRNVAQLARRETIVTNEERGTYAVFTEQTPKEKQEGYAREQVYHK